MHRYWPLIVSLAAVWGASYLFIKVAVEEIPPAPMMAARALVAGAILVVYLLLAIGARQALHELRASWHASLVLGLFNGALPFWLVAWGEQHVDSSVAAIAQSTVPIFVFLLGLRFLPHEPIGGLRLAGVALGLLGVVVLAGLDPRGGWWAAAGTLAVVLSSLSYASAGIYGQLRLRTASGPVLATGSMLIAGLVLAPFALLELPTEAPSVEAVGSLAALTLLGTALGQLALFRILRLYGSHRLSLVTYLIPGFALVYGAAILGEPITAAAAGGLVLILVGVALGSGARPSLPRARERPA